MSGLVGEPLVPPVIVVNAAPAPGEVVRAEPLTAPLVQQPVVQAAPPPR